MSNGLGNFENFEEYRYEIFLCKSHPPYDVIGCLSGCLVNKTLKEEMLNVNEFTATLYKYWNDNENSVNEYYDLLQGGKTILLEKYIDDTLLNRQRFYITQPNEITEGIVRKEFVAYSLEYLMNRIKIREFSFTTKLYDFNNDWDSQNPNTSGILNYLFDELLKGSWMVNYISSSLLTTQRTFDIATSTIYETIKNIESQWNCVFFFDSYNKTVDIKSYDELNTQTGLILSDENYISSLIKEIKTDEIVTRLYVTGDGIGIGGLTLTGQSYLDDFSYFRNSNYMSNDLLTALNEYDVVLSNNQTNFTNLLTTLSTYQTQKLNLEVELFNIETNLNIYIEKENGAIKFGNYDGQNYNYWHTLYLSTKTQYNNKLSEIEDKQDDIDGVLSNLQTIRNNVSYENNFTTSDLQELYTFINEQDVTFETNNPTELLAYGQEFLNLLSTPPINFNLSMVDILSCKEEAFTWDKLLLGHTIDIMIEELNMTETLRVVMIQHDIDDQNLGISVSNRNYFNDDVNYVSTILSKTKQITDTVVKERDLTKEYIYDKDSILYNDSIINVTNNKIQIGDGSTTSHQTIIDERGIYMRDVLDANGQMRIFGDKILFTNDNWLTYSLGISSTGIQTNQNFKLFTENEVGSNNLVSIDGDGIKIYGSGSVDEGISIYNLNNEKVFGLDTNGNISMTGSINITGGNVGDLAFEDEVDFATQVVGAEKPENNATVGANWSTNLLNIPNTLTAPNGEGLFLSDSHLGFYDDGTWKTYMDDSGNFYLGGTSGKLQWNSLSNSLTIRGNITIESGSSGISNLSDAGNLATADDLDDVSDGSVYKRTTQNEKTGASLAYSGLDSNSNLTTSVLPNQPILTPNSNGLYLGSDVMGYYENGWKSYIRNDGTFGFKGDTTNYVEWDGSDLVVRGGLVADDIKSGSITTSNWDGSGTNYITMSRKLMYFKENTLTKMAIGFLPDKDNIETPIIVMGAGDGNGNNRGYIEKSTDGLSLYYIGNKTQNEISYVKLQKDKAVINGYEILSTNSTIGDDLISSATVWNDKISEEQAKTILEEPTKNWDIAENNLANLTITKIANGDSAWGKFSGVGNTIPSGNVEFNFANSSTKGGNAINTDNVGTQSSTTVQNSVINFNGRNDRISTTPANPTILTDGTSVDHSINTDGSSNISFEWGFTGSGNAYNIDGFIVYIRESTSSTAYTFGTSTSEEQVFYVTPDKRSFIVYGVPSNKYYTFGIQAYRIVDSDVNASEILKSSIIKPSLSSENPYRPSSTVAFNGNITGTVDGLSASTVKLGSQKANLGLDTNGTLITKAIPSSNINVPDAEGIYLGKDYMGYHDGTNWTAFIDNTGQFKFEGDGNNVIYWDGLALTIRGQLNADDIVAGQVNAQYLNAKGLTVQNTSLQTTFSIDSNGNVYVSGQIIMGVGSSLSWDYVSDKPTIPTQYTDSEALQSWINSGYSTNITSAGIYTGNITANQINSGILSTQLWSGSGTDYIRLQRQVALFVQDNNGTPLTKMAMGFLNDKDGIPTPIIVLGAGDGNGNNRGYIEKSTDGLSLYYIGDKTQNEISYVKLQKDKAVINGYEILSTNSTIGDSLISSATVWNNKISEEQAKIILEEPTKNWNIPIQNLDSSTGTKINNGDSAFSYFDPNDQKLLANKLKDASVVTSNLANSAVNNSKLANLAVDASKLVDGAVTSTKISNLAVETSKLADGAITSAKIANLAVGNSAIANLAVGSAKIADLAVSEAKIGNLAVTTGKIANLAVNTAKIDNLAVTNAKIGNLAVDSAKISDLAVTNAKIDDLAVTNAKIANLSAGKLNAGTLSTQTWDGTGNNYITMARQLIYFKEDTLNKMAIGFLPNNQGSQVPLLILGAGSGNDSSVNKGYIEKSVDSLNLYFVGSNNQASGIQIKANEINVTHELKLNTALSDQYISSATSWNEKLNEQQLKDVVQNGTKNLGIVDGNVGFNFADSTSKGGNAKNTDAVGNQTSTTVQNSVINFNGRNDRISTTPANPIILTDGTALDHVLNTDGSCDISFEWGFTGTGNAYNIDGFILYVRQSTSSSAYTFGTFTSEEQVFYVTPEKRAFILYGVASNKYYTFGVQSYRIVDADVNSSNVLKSSIIKPSLSSENPYRPSSSVAFSGDITGTVDNVNASIISSGALDGANAWGKFSGVGNTIPSGNVEFNYAGASSKGGNATNTNNVGSRTSSQVVTGVDRATSAINSSLNIVSKVKPESSWGTPTSSGLYHGSDYLGFYNSSTSAWTSYIKNDGTFKFQGNSNNFIEWNGSSLNVKGGIVADGSIQGGTISIGTNNSIFKADSNGIYLGNATFSNAPFRVTMNGNLYATSSNITGTISSSTITGSTITGGTLQTSTSGNDRIVISSDSLICYNSSNQKHGLWIDPSSVVDLVIYKNNSKMFEVYDNLVGSVSLRAYQNSMIRYSSADGKTYADGTWNFSGTNIEGFTVKFA